jgi:hypothetical protein
MHKTTTLWFEQHTRRLWRHVLAHAEGARGLRDADYIVVLPQRARVLEEVRGAVTGPLIARVHSEEKAVRVHMDHAH